MFDDLPGKWCVWYDISWSETWIISIYNNRLGCCDKLTTRVQTHALEYAILMLYTYWTSRLQHMHFGRVPINLQMDKIRQLVRSVRMSSYVDPRSKLTSCGNSWSTYAPETFWCLNYVRHTSSRDWILKDQIRPCSGTQRLKKYKL